MKTVALGLLLLSVAACSRQGPSGSPTAVVLEVSPEPATAVASPQATEGGLCANAYQPISDGASWSYQGSGTGGEYSRTDLIDDVEAEGFVVETSLSDIQYFVTWKCTSEGLVNMRADGGMLEAAFRGVDDVIQVETISSEGVTLPNSISPGDEWKQTTSLMFTSSIASGGATITHEAEAIGMDSVTVPAGTFQAMRIDVTSTMDLAAFPGGEDITFEATYWLVPDLGLVRMAGGGDALGVEFETEIRLAFSSLL